MSSAPAIPRTTVMLPMQSSDQADACPDVDRCQLELIRNDEEKMPLIIENGATNNTGLLRIGLMKKGAGCAYRCRIGMMRGRRLVAVGDSGSPLYNVWETELINCRREDTPLFEHRPYNLTQVRYKHVGKYISLFHYDYTVFVDGEEPQGYKAVAVLRQGQMYTRAYPADNSCQAWGALSDDFKKLYISQSTSFPGGERIISYELHYWDDTAVDWVQAANGSVDVSAWEHSQDCPVVMRDGRIAAAWSDHEVTTYNENVNIADGCFANEPGEEIYYKSHAGDSTEYAYGMFNIDTRRMESGAARSRGYGLSLVDGDMTPLLGRVTGENKREYICDGAGYDVAAIDAYNRWRYFTVSDDQRYGTMGDVALGGDIVAEVMDGQVINYSASYDHHEHKDTTCVTWYFHDVTYSLGHYDRKAGVVTPGTVGGWVYVAESYQKQDPVGDYTQNVSGCGPWSFPVGCPRHDTYINHWLAPNLENVSSARTVHPIAMSYNTIASSFHVYDEEMDIWYAGICCNHSDGGSYSWRIYENGIEVTGQVADCVGDLFDNHFSAIFIR